MSGSTNRGVTSLGFNSTAEPANSAGTASSSDSIIGAFQGLMTPTSGYGTSCERILTVGMLREGPLTCARARMASASSHQPLMFATAMKAVNWEVWQPPLSAPSAAPMTLAWASSAATQRRMMSIRSPIGRAAHAGWLRRSRAAFFATSAAVAAGKENSVAPVRGLRTGIERVSISAIPPPANLIDPA